MPVPADLEVQLDLVGIGVAHLGDLLTLGDLLSFLHQDVPVVRVRRQVGTVVLDDDELAVAAQAGARVDDLAAGAGRDRLPRRAGDVDALETRRFRECR